jgi:hypothetical protein
MTGKLQSMPGCARMVLSAVCVVLVAVGAAGALLAISACSAKVTGKTASQRKQAVCDITDKQPSGAVDALVLTAGQDKEADVRQAAVVGLGRFNSPEARQAVERALADPSPQVRTAAAGTLGLFGDQAAADKLGALAASQASLAERKASLLGLARCESERSIMWLLDTAEKTENDTVKLAAFRELYKKFGMRYLGAGPANQGQWLNHIEIMKEYPQVQRAYAQAGRPLERHPENRRIHIEAKPDLQPASAPGDKQP